MQLNEREASLVDAFRRLPRTQRRNYPRSRTDRRNSRRNRIDWSDSWSDEDLNDFRAASLRRPDAEESEDRD
jgi:hypothetical protein